MRKLPLLIGSIVAVVGSLSLAILSGSIVRVSEVFTVRLSDPLEQNLGRWQIYSSSPSPVLRWWRDWRRSFSRPRQRSPSEAA